MKRLATLTLSAALLAGCSTMNGPRLDTLAGSSWSATGIDIGNSGGPGANPPLLQFVSLEQVAGSGGCNRFNGKAAVDGETLRLGPLAATRMACSGPAMANEAAFFKALEATRRARIDGAQLVLQDESGAELIRLTRAE